MTFANARHELDPRQIYGRPVKIAIADDHPLLLSGLTYELEKHPGVTVVGGPGTVAAAFGELAELGFDEVLVRHLAEDHTEVLRSSGRLAEVRAAVADT